jgi:hypothetical protein
VAYQTPPRATLSMEPTASEYEQAALTAARYTGWLRLMPIVAGTAAILVILSISSALQWHGDFTGLVLSLLIGVLSVVAAVWFATAARRSVCRKAARDYTVFTALRLPMTVALYEDYAEVTSPSLTEKRHYALGKLLAETAELLVIVEEEQQFLVLPKRCLSETDQAFLRDVFARRYRKTLYK